MLQRASLTRCRRRWLRSCYRRAASARRVSRCSSFRTRKRCSLSLTTSSALSVTVRRRIVALCVRSLPAWPLLADCAGTTAPRAAPEAGCDVLRLCIQGSHICCKTSSSTPTAASCWMTQRCRLQPHRSTLAIGPQLPCARRRARSSSCWCDAARVGSALPPLAVNGAALWSQPRRTTCADDSTRPRSVAPCWQQLRVVAAASGRGRGRGSDRHGLRLRSPRSGAQRVDQPRRSPAQRRGRRRERVCPLCCG